MTRTLDINTLQLMMECAMDARKQVFIEYKDEKNIVTARVFEPIKWLRPHKDNTSDGFGVLTYCKMREHYRHFKLYRINRILISDLDFEWVNENIA